jgi:hypothetical protein
MDSQTHPLIMCEIYPLRLKKAQFPVVSSNLQTIYNVAS